MRLRNEKARCSWGYSYYIFSLVGFCDRMLSNGELLVKMVGLPRKGVAWILKAALEIGKPLCNLRMVL
ncbi:MAG: hypothetical protein IJ320_01310 [Phascolarctobacterium sp.]|nr:hypothetical protein [Phascolarctobacterium sp.]